MQLEHIAIVGGGPGGLTLARVLQTHGISSTVLELDEHALARPQGGSLDLHAESGQHALREAGLEAAFRACARYDDQADALYDHDGVKQFEHDGQDGDRPEIDRTQLRDLLLASLPARTVRWGRRITAIEPIAGGRHRVVGADGPIGDFDLVVGADGAWSKVRPLVSTAVPAFTGMLCAELAIDDVDRKHPEVAALLPRGKTTVVGGDRGLIAQRSSGGHVRVYLMLRTTDAALRGDPGAPPLPSTRAAVRASLAGFAPSLLAFIDAAPDHVTLRPIVALPTGHRWDHVPGVTLLGDAAHVMSPFSGEGVNVAMRDALELGLAIAGGGDVDAAIARYEEEMFVRAATAAAGANAAVATWPAQTLSFIEDVKRFRARVAAGDTTARPPDPHGAPMQLEG